MVCIESYIEYRYENVRAGHSNSTVGFFSYDECRELHTAGNEDSDG